MPYTPNTWQSGDTITSAKLNNIEQGISALYPQETIIAPEQTVTITDAPVAITLARGTRCRKLYRTTGR